MLHIKSFAAILTQIAANGSTNLRLFCDSVRKQRRGQIAVAGIGQEDDDVLARVLGPLGHLDGRPQGRAGGNADEDALGPADELAGGKRIFVLDRDDLVIDLGVQHVGDEARADALDLVRPATPVDRTAEVFGSTATTLTEASFDFKNSPTPVIVPPVPTPATK